MPQAPLQLIRPGERLLHGKVVVFNMKLLVAYESDKVCDAAPSDLNTLSDDELTGLFYAWLNRSARHPRHPETLALGTAVCALRAGREAAHRERAA